MNNVIFGGGVVALIAKRLLPTWKVVPFAASRFFSFNPALDDNFLVRHEAVDEPVRDLVQAPAVRTFLYRRAFDIAGQLHGRYDKDLLRDWQAKIFGQKTPPQTEPYFAGKLDLHIYDVRVNQLFQSLAAANMAELKAEQAKGQVTEIGDHYFVRGGVREEFDNAISTIPLPALNKLMGFQQELPAKTVHFLHVQTDTIDFEGFNQTLVVDPKLSFYKVTNIAPKRYMFYCHEEIPHPGHYLMGFLRDFDIIDGTTVADYLPMGPIPKTDHVEKRGVYCVGSYAQWDWCMDVSSCILRLVRYAQRGFKPFQRQVVK